MVMRNVEYCGQQVGFIMHVDPCQIAKQNTISFHNGELESVNDIQGPLLLILHLTNMSHQCRVNIAEDLNQNRMYKA
jgi:hypothetical protein